MKFDRNKRYTLEYDGVYELAESGMERVCSIAAIESNDDMTFLVEQSGKVTEMENQKYELVKQGVITVKSGYYSDPINDCGMSPRDWDYDSRAECASKAPSNMREYLQVSGDDPEDPDNCTYAYARWSNGNEVDDVEVVICVD